MAGYPEVILSGWARSLCTSLLVLGNGRCGKWGSSPSCRHFSCKRVASPPLNPSPSTINAAPSVRTDIDLIKYLTNYPFPAIERREHRTPALLDPSQRFTPKTLRTTQRFTTYFLRPLFSYSYKPLLPQ